ncbi:MAG: hypothetical protein DRN15_10820 [Thermoprotei archaeon]|nr:MAG: hypothetical protein DRN15_10820 [Thermoprotei archaeon]
MDERDWRTIGKFILVLMLWGIWRFLFGVGEWESVIMALLLLILLNQADLERDLERIERKLEKRKLEKRSRAGYEGA